MILRLTAAALAVAVAYIHIKDQGGFPGDKLPRYVGVGYYLLEAAAGIAAVALIVGHRNGQRQLHRIWVVMVGIAIAPIVGYVLSRGPGLPDYTDDKGNWTEPIGVASLVVEGLLLLIAGVVLARARRGSTSRP